MVREMKPKHMGLGWTFVFIGAFSFLTGYNMLAHLELWELLTRFYTLEKVQLQSFFLVSIGTITAVVGIVLIVYSIFSRPKSVFELRY